MPVMFAADWNAASLLKENGKILMSTEIENRRSTRRSCSSKAGISTKMKTKSQKPRGRMNSNHKKNDVPTIAKPEKQLEERAQGQQGHMDPRRRAEENM